MNEAGAAAKLSSETAPTALTGCAISKIVKNSSKKFVKKIYQKIRQKICQKNCQKIIAMNEAGAAAKLSSETAPTALTGWAISKVGQKWAGNFNSNS